MLTQICIIHCDILLETKRFYFFFRQRERERENERKREREKKCWNILLDMIGGGNTKYDYRKNSDIHSEVVNGCHPKFVLNLFSLLITLV